MLGDRVFIPARPKEIEARARGGSHQLLLQKRRALKAPGARHARGAVTTIGGSLEPQQRGVQSLLGPRFVRFGLGGGTVPTPNVVLGKEKRTVRKH